MKSVEWFGIIASIHGTATRKEKLLPLQSKLEKQEPSTPNHVQISAEYP